MGTKNNPQNYVAGNIAQTSSDWGQDVFNPATLAFEHIEGCRVLHASGQIILQPEGA